MTERKEMADPRDLVLTLCPVKSLGTRPGPSIGHSLTLVSQRLLLFGGCNENKLLGDMYSCDIGTRVSATQVVSIPVCCANQAH